MTCCPRPEQVLLRRLSVFAGWSLEMAEQVCADGRLPAEQIIDASAGLVDKSLVVVEPEVLGQARYRLLDSVRAYAAQRLADGGRVRRRPAPAARLRAVRTPSTPRRSGMAEIPAGWAAAVDVFRRYDVDAGNLRQVLSRCQATGDVRDRAAAVHRGPAVLDRPRPLRRGRGVVRPVPGPGPHRAAARRCSARR